MSTTRAEGLPFLPGNAFVDPTVSYASSITYCLLQSILMFVKRLNLIDFWHGKERDEICTSFVKSVVLFLLEVFSVNSLTFQLVCQRSNEYDNGLGALLVGIIRIPN